LITDCARNSKQHFLFTVSSSRFRVRLFAAYSLLYASSMNMHAARTALNNDPELRQWVENWLKDKERTANPNLGDEEFEKHWRYVRPERMHEGALEALSAHPAAAQNE
jgi:hypothetical protein